MLAETQESTQLLPINPGFDGECIVNIEEQQGLLGTLVGCTGVICRHKAEKNKCMSLPSRRLYVGQKNRYNNESRIQVVS